MLTDDKGKKGGKQRQERTTLGLGKDYRYRGTTISFRSSAHFDLPAHFNFFWFHTSHGVAVGVIPAVVRGRDPVCTFHSKPQNAGQMLR